MNMPICLSILLSFSVAHAGSYFPFVQTHTFEMEPYLKSAQGYALFVVSSEFDGTELVKVKAPHGERFPDIQTSERVLSQFSNGMWYIPDNERTLSAMGGPLSHGVYEYSISNAKGTETIQFQHNNSFLKPVWGIHVEDQGDKFYFSWEATSEADTFWVFIFPSDTKNILKDLKPVSSVMHRKCWYSLMKRDLEPGIYKIAIRANRIWEGDTFWALDSEAWSISKENFTVP